MPRDSLADWLVNGTPVCDSVGNRMSPAVTVDGSGGAILAWQESSDIYLQRIDATGNRPWGPSGSPVCEAAGDQEEVKIVPDGAGGAIVMWLDHRLGSRAENAIYAQRVNADGVPLWAEDGVTVYAGPNASALQLISDGLGGAIAVWADLRARQTDIYAQRLNGSGVSEWNPNGFAIAHTVQPEISPLLVPDGAGGAIVAWAVDSLGTSLGVWADRIGSDGSFVWNASGIRIGQVGSRLLTMTSDEAGGAVVCWDQVMMRGEVRVQRLNTSGEVQWNPAGVLVHYWPPDTHLISDAESAPDGDGGAFLLLRQGKSGAEPSEPQFYSQHIDGTGVPLWGTQARPIATPYPVERGKMTSDEEGGVILTWGDLRECVTCWPPLPVLVRAQHLDAAGNPRWGTQGVDLCDLPNGGSPVITSDAEGSVVIGWAGDHDSPGNYNIYARRLDGAGLKLITLVWGSGGQVGLMNPPLERTAVHVGAYDESSFRIVPNPGYFINTVTLDGNAMDPRPNWDLGHASTDHTLNVTFANGTWTEPVIRTPRRVYTSVAFPLTFTNDSVAVVLNALGMQDDNFWRMARWDPMQGAYQYAGASLQTLTAGAGYWLVTADGSEVVAKGSPLMTDPVELSLPGPSGGGWQQIASPFRFVVADSALRVSTGTAWWRLNDPANPLTDSVLHEWTGAGYETTHTLEPRRAYWLRTRVAGPVKLRFPNWSSEIPPEPGGGPAGARWSVALEARQENRASARVIVGLCEPTTDPRRMRIEWPPSPPGGVLSLRVCDEESGAPVLVGSFSSDMEHREWVLELSGAAAPGEVILTATGSDLPPGLRLWIRDPDDQWTQELVVGAPVSVAARTEPRRLLLRAGGAAEWPSNVQLEPSGFNGAYPNPFCSQVGLVFRSARFGEVRAEIYDVQGRRVRGLQSPRLPAGEHVLVWDGTDTGGHAVPCGIYLARCEAAGRQDMARLVKVH